MSGNCRHWRVKLGLVSCLAIGGAIATSRVTAQITPDSTLGGESSVVTPNVDIKGVPSDQIDGGAVRGANLFHSFGEFNVGEGRAAYFTNPAGIENILSRVTGGNVSQIFGKLGVLGNANLFLINPNGIVFGASSSLDIGGSFVGSTASSVRFADGIDFTTSAANQTTPLLTVSVPLGLQVGSNPGSIVVQGGGRSLPQQSDRASPEARIAFEQNFLDNSSGLQVQPGKTLVLVGGNVALEGGILKAPAGRIELASVASPNYVSLNPTDLGFALGYEGIQSNSAQSSYGDIQLSQQSAVAASGSGGGEIQVQGGRVTLSEDSAIFADTLGNQNGRNVSIGTNQLSLQGGSAVMANTFSPSVGGNLTVKALDSVEIVGTSSVPSLVSGVETATFGAGATGNLTINTGRLIVRDGAVASAATFGQGKGGSLSVNATKGVEVSGTSLDGQYFSALFTDTTGSGDSGEIAISTPTLIVRDGGLVSARTFGEGDGGSLSINATDGVEVSGTSPNGQSVSALSTQTLKSGSGGNLTIDTGALIVRDGAWVSADTSGTGKGGNVLVRAKDSLQVLGTRLNGLPTQLSAGVSLGEGPRGDGGNLRIETGALSIRDGGNVSTETAGQGNAGNLQISARDLVEVVGQKPATSDLLLEVNSRLTSGVGPSGIGKGGNLSIETNKLSIRDGGQVSAGLFGQGKGGDIQVRAGESVEVIGIGSNNLSSELEANVYGNAQGQGGNINIDTRVLNIRDGGLMSAGTNGRGEAGNIKIRATDAVEIVGALNSEQRQSSINTSPLPGAIGNGGSVTVETGRLTLRDGNIFTSTSAEDAGDISIQASDAVQLSGNSNIGAGTLPDAIGNGGRITITTRRLQLIDNSSISAYTSGRGRGGNIAVRAPESVQLSGKSSLSAPTSGAGDAGNVDIETGLLQLADDSYISAFTYGGGRGGNITIRALDSVQISDASILAVSTLSDAVAGDLTIETGQLIAQDPGVKISAASLPGSTGNGGNVTLKANQLIVRGGAQVQTSTYAAGNAGNLTVKADTVEVTGTTPDGRFSSALFADSDGAGSAGSLTIDTSGRLLVRDGGLVSVRGRGSGFAGNLEVTAGNLQLDNGTLEATTAAGDRGNITVRSQSVQLRRGSTISTKATGEATGGNINIDTKVLIAFPDENSDIIAEAQQGRGGNIDIDADAIFGIQQHTEQTEQNDITASSQLGINGTIQLNTLEIDPEQGLVQLPAELVDASGLIAQGCPAIGSENKFIITGRGGLPPSPSGRLSSEAVLTSWATLAPPIENRAEAGETTPEDTNWVPTPIVEAQSWAIAPTGEVILTASAPIVTSNNLLPSAKCHGL